MKKILLFLLSIPLLTGCGEEEGNTFPQLENPLGSRFFQAGFGAQAIDLSGVFSDPDGDVLAFTATSSNEAVVTVGIEEDNMLALTEAGLGIAAVIVTAEDGRGASASDTLEVNVNVEPYAWIFGTWQLIATSSGEYRENGLEWIVTPVENGRTFEIQTDGTFSRSPFVSCITGEVTLTSDKITFHCECDGTLSLNYELKDSQLSLIPIPWCDEGCAYLWEKIAEAETQGSK